MKNKRVTVIGSINMDLVTLTNRVPVMGETVMGESFHTTPGGKGANQAVAAARLGADTTMIGCVGNDSFGRELVQHLQMEGINTENVKPVTHCSTGIASITLANRDNQIIVAPGANFQVTPEFVASHEEVIANSGILLLQLEVPLESVETAVELANKHQVQIILNPAPIQKLPKELLLKVDYLTPNEHEQHLLFSSADWTEEERLAILKKCIVTRGSKGITVYRDQQIDLPSFKVDAVDTTGAGDTFNGALAYYLSEGASLENACKYAIASAALSVTKFGAQGGMPTNEQVKEFLETQKRNEAK